MKYPAEFSKGRTYDRMDRKMNPELCRCEHPVPSGDYGEDKRGEYEVCEMCGKKIYKE